MDQIIRWFETNAVFLGALAAAVAVVAAGLKPFARLFSKREPTPQPATTNLAGGQSGGRTQQAGRVEGDMVGGDSVRGDKVTNIGADADRTVDKLIAESKKVGRLEEKTEQLESRLGDVEAERNALREAVVALQRQQAEAPVAEADRIGKALALLERGDTEAAEAQFRAVLDAKSAEGEAANKEAAQAARHLGALAYLQNTQKALAAYERAVGLDPDDPDGWIWIGNLRMRLGQLELAEQAYERVLALGNQAADKGIEPHALNGLGLIYRTRGELDRAEEAHEKALAFDTELGRNGGVAANYGNLGLIYQTRGELDRAEEAHGKALALETELGRKEGIASQYGNLGLIYRKRGELDRAEEAHGRALALETELGRTDGMANQHGNLGLIYQTRGELGRAEAVLGKALALHAELGHKEGMAAGYGNLGLIYETRGELDWAEEAHEKALALHTELGSKEGMAGDYGNLGLIAHRRGEIDAACAYWTKSVALYREIGIEHEAEEVIDWMRDAGCPDIPVDPADTPAQPD